MRQGLISMIADKPGIEVAGEASSGEEALELARRLSPDVIIMDISMPGIGGVEATRLIKAENPEIRVIGLSMFAEEDISQKMREAGADGFVSKSESSSELLKAIYEVRRDPGAATSKRLLNYLLAEIELVRPCLPQWSTFIRVHHRSGMFGMYGGVEGGSNFIGAGIRYYF
jgi:DNA-binding NarL/FixJ family response regulator